jgi:gamma-glutamylcyclotransferase (GGCT)/AIG2-like uncharacterized protein YtfP
MTGRRRGAGDASPRCRLFVYGSLMRGEPNHHVLGSSAVFLGLARTARRYRLLDLGPYPALVEGGSCSIAGELYEIASSILPELDRFEGPPDLYRRASIELDGGGVVTGYLAAAAALASGPHAVIECGDWRERPR